MRVQVHRIKRFLIRPLNGVLQIGAQFKGTIQTGSCLLFTRSGRSHSAECHAASAVSGAHHCPKLGRVHILLEFSELRILVGEDVADLAVQLTTGAVEGAGIASFHNHDAIAALVEGLGATTNEVQSCGSRAKSFCKTS